MKKSLCLLIILLFSQSLFSNIIELTQEESDYLKNRKIIDICIIPEAMPYSDIADGKLTGFISDYVKIIENKLDITLKLIPTSNTMQTMKLIKQGKCELIPMIQFSEEKEKFLNFTTQYADIPFVLVTTNEKPFYTDIKKIKNRTLVAVRGQALTDILKDEYKNFNLIEVDSLDKAFKMVANDEVFGVIVALSQAVYKKQQRDFANLKVSGQLNKNNYFRIAVSENNTILFNIFNKAVESITEDEVKKILDKWLYIEYKEEFDIKLLFQILTIFIIVLIAILYRQRFLHNVNSELKRKVKQKTKELVSINSKLEERIKIEVDKNIKVERLLSRQSKMASMGEMLENIAHQWRQPLTVISTAASSIKLQNDMKVLDDNSLNKTLDQILKISTYLSTTIEDFRSFFKPQEEKEKFEISDALKKSLDLLSTILKEIEVITNIENHTILGFENSLVQVFINILNNSKDAFKNTKVGKKLIFIDIYKKDTDIIITIKDNAGGIPDKILSKITELYFTTKHKSVGTGIGLYMCEEILKRHMNATLDIQNKEFEYEGTEYKGALVTITMKNIN